MKILHVVIDEQYVEGASYQENVLSKKHVDLGFDTYLISSQRLNGHKYVEPSEYINKDGVKVSILRCSSRKSWYYLFSDKCIGLRKKIFDICPDIIFVHNIIFKDIRHIIEYKEMHPEVRIFSDSHRDYYNSPVSVISRVLFFFFYKKRLSRFIPYCEKFWGTTPWREDYLEDVYKIPKDKVDLLVMGGDELYIDKNKAFSIRNNIRDKYNIPHNSFLVVTGGRLDRRKQQILLLDAVRQLEKLNVYLLVFGNPTDEMKDSFNNYTKISNIKMIGKIPPVDIYNIYLASDLAFFPGTHSVLWEQAVASEVPIVVKHWRGMEHINVNGNALLLDDITVISIKNTIKRLLNTEDFFKMKQCAIESSKLFLYNKIAQKAIGL